MVFCFQLLKPETVLASLLKRMSYIFTDISTGRGNGVDQGFLLQERDTSEE